jgi:hypothetical protein
MALTFDDLSRNLDIENSTGDSHLPFRYTISSYGADYPVDGFVNRPKDGTICR